jgi:hypothetical protein
MSEGGTWAMEFHCTLLLAVLSLKHQYQASERTINTERMIRGKVSRLDEVSIDTQSKGHSGGGLGIFYASHLEIFRAPAGFLFIRHKLQRGVKNNQVSSTRSIRLEFGIYHLGD